MDPLQSNSHSPPIIKSEVGMPGMSYDSPGFSIASARTCAQTIASWPLLHCDLNILDDICLPRSHGHIPDGVPSEGRNIFPPPGVLEAGKLGGILATKESTWLRLCTHLSPNNASSIPGPCIEQQIHPTSTMGNVSSPLMYPLPITSKRKICPI